MVDRADCDSLELAAARHVEDGEIGEIEDVEGGVAQQQQPVDGGRRGEEADLRLVALDLGEFSGSELCAAAGENKGVQAIVQEAAEVGPDIEASSGQFQRFHL